MWNGNKCFWASKLGHFLKNLLGVLNVGDVSGGPYELPVDDVDGMLGEVAVIRINLLIQKNISDKQKNMKQPDNYHLNF